MRRDIFPDFFPVVGLQKMSMQKPQQDASVLTEAERGIRLETLYGLGHGQSADYGRTRGLLALRPHLGALVLAASPRPYGILSLLQSVRTSRAVSGEIPAAWET